MQEDDADLARVEARVAARDLAHEVVELGHDLDAREPAPGHHEGEELLAQGLVVALDRRLVEGANDVVAQVEGVAEVLERERVLGQAAQAAEVGDAAEGQHQVVEGNDVGMRPEAGAGDDDLLLEVDLLHVADVEVGARQEAPDGTDHVEDPDRPGDHLRQHGLEDEVVLLVDEDDLDVLALAHRLLQLHRGVDAGEAAAQDHDTRTLLHALLDAHG